VGVGGRAARRGGVSRCKGTPLCVACRAALPLRGGGRVARRGGGAWRGGSGRWALARRWRGGFGSPPPRALSGRAPSVLRGGAARGRCAAAALPPAALGRGGTIGGSGVLLASHPPCSPLTPFARGRRAAWRRRALRRGGRSAVGAGSRAAPPPLPRGPPHLSDAAGRPHVSPRAWRDAARGAPWLRSYAVVVRAFTPMDRLRGPRAAGRRRARRRGSSLPRRQARQALRCSRCRLCAGSAR